MGSCSAPDLDSSNEGVCASGPAEQFCSIETFRGCSTNADCTHAGDSCGVAKFRECFTTSGTPGDQVSAGGVASSTNPTLAGLFCRGPGVASAENTAFGYPGLVRMTIPGTATTN